MKKDIENKTEYEKWLKNNKKFKRELFEIKGSLCDLIIEILIDYWFENGQKIIIEYLEELNSIYNKKIINDILVKKWENQKLFF